MDSIGDYLYLIILAVAGLSGLLKKKKETTNTTNKPSPTSTKQSWEEVLRDLIPIENDEVINSDEVIPQAVIKSPEPFLNFEANLAQTLPREKKQKTRFVDTFYTKDKADSKKTDDEATDFLTQIQLSTLDDAKKAFIYSEVFNRKY